VLANVVHSQDDFNSVFSQVSSSVGTNTGGTNQNTPIVLKINPTSSLKDNFTAAGLNPLLQNILFSPESTATIEIDSGSHVVISVVFPSSLFFKDATNSGTGSFSLSGTVSADTYSVGIVPTDTRVWGSEFISPLTDGSTFTPLNSVTGSTVTGVSASGGNMKTSTASGTGSSPQMLPVSEQMNAITMPSKYGSGVKIATPPPGVGEDAGVVGN